MMARFDEIDDLAIYERLMKVNYLGCVYPTHYALPHLKKSRGQIVVMSSLAGLTECPRAPATPPPNTRCSGSSTPCASSSTGPGVSVTMVAPYFVLSEIHRRSTGPDGKPLGKSPMQEDKIMTAEACAALTVAGWRGASGSWSRTGGADG
jgi:NADP-dependent 3-hydroxy acid dehydrogenase YdfG